MTSKILITGGTGFLGIHLTEYLLAEGYSVATFSRGRPREGNSQPCRHIKGDVGDLNAVRRAAKDADGVIHLAGVSRESVAEADPYRCLFTNALGAVNILEAARSAVPKPWIILASSATVRDVAGTDGLPALAATGGIYGVSKLFGELCARWYAAQYAMRIAALRCETIYGSWRDNMGKAVNKITTKALANDAIDIHQPAKTINLVHYADVVKAISAVIKRFSSPGRPYYECIYLGSPQSITLKELAAKILELAGSRSAIHIHDDADKNLGVQRSKAESYEPSKLLGLRPSITVDKGLRKLVEQRRLSYDVR